MKNLLLGNLGTKFMAVFLAVLMWVYLYSAGNDSRDVKALFDPVLPPELEGELYIQYKSAGERLEPRLSTIDLKVTGPRSDIRSPQIQALRCEPRLDATFFPAESGSFFYPLFEKDFNLPENFRADLDQRQIDITYERFIERTLPLIATPLDVEGAPKEGFEVKQVVCNVQEIKVLVPARKGETLKEIRIRKPNIAGLAAQVIVAGQIATPDSELPVKLVKGQDFLVTVVIDFVHFSKEFTVPLRLEGDPAVLPRIQLDTTTVKVVIDGPRHIVEKLTESDFRIFLPILLSPAELKPEGEKRTLRDLKHYYVRDPNLRSILKVTITPDEAVVTVLPQKP